MGGVVGALHKVSAWACHRAACGGQVLIVPTRTWSSSEMEAALPLSSPGPPAGLKATQTAGAGLALIGFFLGTAFLSPGKGRDRILSPGASPGTLRGPPSLTGEILLPSPSRVGERDPRQEFSRAQVLPKL